MGDFWARLSSRKFILAALGFIFTILTVVLEINVSVEQWAALVGFITSFIAAEGYADAKKIENGEEIKEDSK